MNENYIGSLILSASYYFIPPDCLPCDGRLLLIKDYEPLFSIIGKQYGGDGKVNFALPNLVGKAAIGAGLSDFGTRYLMGQQGGEETVVLNPDNLPIHKHAVTWSSGSLAEVTEVEVNAGTDASQATNVPTGNYWGAPTPISFQSINAYTDKTNTRLNPDAVGTTDLPSPDVEAMLYNAGDTQAHENRLPFLILNWLIVVNGLYPTRT